MGFPARLEDDEARRTRSVFGFFGAGGREAAHRELEVGPGPEWIEVRGTALAAVPAGKMLFAGHGASGATLGELADALVFLPRTAPRETPPAAGDPHFEKERERRWRLLREAHR